MDPTVDIIHGVTQEQFQTDIYPKRKPVILRGQELGPCLKTWTPLHLSEMGGDKPVKVHVSPTSKMDFTNKNFAYRTLPFDELVRRAAQITQSNFFFSEDEKYYLRMVGADARRDVADFRNDFPKLSEEIIFPQFYDNNNYFSSVLRIGSPGIQLWTHYDIMDNFLIQVSGKKRVVLFSPKDTINLYLNGDKSEVLDIDNPNLEKYPNFAKVTKIECFLEAGDVLFIPALWFHNVISLDFSVAVNVFWKHLDEKFYDKKDIYGNKDLVQASQSMQGLDRALKLLDELPSEYRDFYGRRMIAKIQSRTLSEN